ncbi:hypothetical protein DDK21_12745 [Achromobacter xylosoxidans]|uniref:hypothetical protein n=1 Tax=Alcaligenes xylosoxydans xylosoxydans TaxID=85698 RepID=UPI000D709CDA|nr:hypothetical protein [Achromobacter xylosoxidans]PWV40960.1 hypothetical protein DDK21_12745 [Achromobacter xylosoxidans]
MMRSYALAVLLALASPVALAGVTGKYIKQGGELIVKESQRGVQFAFNTNVGAHACSLGDDEPLFARPIDGTRAAWTSEDPTDQCVVLLNFSNRAVQVTTKGCDSYCGMNAAGSMAGKYSQK